MDNTFENIILFRTFLGGKISIKTHSCCFWCKGYFFKDKEEVALFFDFLEEHNLTNKAIPTLPLKYRFKGGESSTPKGWMIVLTEAFKLKL